MGDRLKVVTHSSLNFCAMKYSLKVKTFVLIIILNRPSESLNFHDRNAMHDVHSLAPAADSEQS